MVAMLSLRARAINLPKVYEVYGPEYGVWRAFAGQPSQERQQALILTRVSLR
jgi:hypothetical protein